MPSLLKSSEEQRSVNRYLSQCGTVRPSGVRPISRRSEQSKLLGIFGQQEPLTLHAKTQKETLRSAMLFT